MNTEDSGHIETTALPPPLQKKEKNPTVDS